MGIFFWGTAWGQSPFSLGLRRGFRVCGRDEGATKTDECLRSPPRLPSGAHSCSLDFVGSFYFGCSFTAQSCRSAQPGNQPPLFPSINMSGGGSPEGAEIPALYLFSPLWALFGYFLARQKVTTSPPQRRLEQQEKTACISQQYRLSSDKSPFHDSCEARKNPRNLSSKVAQKPKVCYNQIDIPFT